MFTENLRFFEQILHPQWLARTSKMGQKLLCLLWVKPTINLEPISYGFHWNEKAKYILETMDLNYGSKILKNAQDFILEYAIQHLR